MSAVLETARARPRRPDGQRKPRTVRVWDRFVRVFHWTLVIAFFGAYLSTEHIGWVHKGFGYLAFTLVITRVLWGFVGPGHARFSSFVPRPASLAGYLKALLSGRAPRYVGHNPAGAVMVVALLLAMVGIAVSGWMMQLDAFWGNDLVEETHTWLVDLTLVAVGLHVAANLYASLKHHENLVLAMFTGRKRREPRPTGQGSTSATRHSRAEHADKSAR